ncbi:MAG: hypothetical protein ACYTG2_03950 [Planctomycetota bacterium]
MPAPLAAAATPTGGGTLDLLTLSIETTQEIQTGTTSLVAGRSTFVRAQVRVINGPGSPVPVDGLLRVYVDGVESPDSPIYSDNGPFPAVFPPDPSSEDGTLNFIFLPPASNNVVLEVEVNPPGPNHVTELSSLNNKLSTVPLSFGVQKVTELAYAPIDYRPSGGPTPNLPDPVLIEPGMGDNFVQAIYPTSDWYYHRIDAPSKLWTSSLSGTGSSLLNSLEIDIELMVPEPDFLYAWVPGGLPYNGMSIIGGQVSMGNTQTSRYQRTFAHEVGHSFGLFHNSAKSNVFGVDVEHHLALTEGLPQIKPKTMNDIMVPGLLTPQAWVATGSFEFFYDHFVFNLGGDTALSTDTGPGLMVAGLVDTQTGGVRITHVLGLPDAQPTAPAPEGQVDLILRGYANGSVVRELPVAVRHTADTTVQPRELGFTAILEAPPAGEAPIDRLALGPVGAQDKGTVQLLRSASAPEVSFTSPVGRLADSRVTVSWSATDADGDALTAWLRYSHDGTRWTPVASAVTETSVPIDLGELPAPVEGVARFDLFVSDGLNTTRAVSDPLHGTGDILELGGNPPWIEVVSPDDGTEWAYGATVILHSSGWDLEDRGLQGSDIVWTSDVDGTLGTGRLLSVNTLSVGTHTISATATDSDTLSTADSHVIEVLPRDLPTLEDQCQTDLGFGGPGSSVLSVCGDDLSAGTSADLLLTGAPATTSMWLLAGPSTVFSSYKGGTLVPDASLVIGPVFTDVSGEFNATVPGGLGPLTLYVQCLLVDGSQTLGFGLSNAVQIELLP